MTMYYLRNRWEAVTMRFVRQGHLVRYHCLGHTGSSLGIMDDFGNLV